MMNSRTAKIRHRKTVGPNCGSDKKSHKGELERISRTLPNQVDHVEQKTR